MAESWRNGGAGTTNLGLLINGTDYDITNHAFSAGSVHLPAIGFRAISGVAAGAGTVQLRAKSSAASNAMTIDSNDTVCFVLAEIPK
jgi:hypothetical protein